MSPDEASAVAARLCAACGLCCNGVVFHTVRLQPGDSARALAALGLKLKRKKGQNYILQPCPAFRDAQCSIYPARPERCRLFECRQLKGVVAGGINETVALAKIQDVQQRAEQITLLLERSGKTDPKRPLSKRFEKIIAEPLDPAGDPSALELRNQLTLAMQELTTILNQDFRPPRPAQLSDVATDGDNSGTLAPDLH